VIVGRIDKKHIYNFPLQKKLVFLTMLFICMLQLAQVN